MTRQFSKYLTGANKKKLHEQGIVSADVKKLFSLIYIQGLKKNPSLHQEMKDICHLEDT